MLRIGSCFSGVGGLDLGVELAGIGRTVFQIEWEDYQTRVLERHWPNAARYRDIEKVRGPELPKVDVVIGGFPCTGFSKAGHGEGLKNEQSKRWFDMLRIIAATKPVGVLIENVLAMLRERFDADRKVIYEGLEALGYEVDAPIAFDSFEVEAPHHRERLFIVAVKKGTSLHPRALDAIQKPMSVQVPYLFPAPRNMPQKPGEPPRTMTKGVRHPYKAGNSSRSATRSCPTSRARSDCACARGCTVRRA